MAVKEPRTSGPQELLRRLEGLTSELERVGDERARHIAEELSACILELHGVGLARIMAGLEGEDELNRKLVDDPVVASLLLIHDLHPVPLEERVVEALDQVRPYMESHGGNVELLGIEDGVARLRLQGSCDGCAASASTLELAISKALQETAPDLFGIHVDNEVPEPGTPGISGTPLQMAGSAEPAPFWLEIDNPHVGPGELDAVQANGTRLLVANVEGSLLAYVDRCTACGEQLTGGDLSDGVLSCPSCARRYFLPRAGRSLDDERIQLEPVPLLEGQGAGVKVALPG